MKNGSDDLNNLYQKCVQFNPIERITEEKIKNILIDEIDSFVYFLENLLSDQMKINCLQINHIIFECIINQLTDESLSLYQKHILNYQKIFAIKIDKYESFISLFEELKENGYFKEISNNSDYFVYLVENYIEGFLEDEDVSQIQKTYDESSKIENSKHLVYSGIKYKNGFGVEKDYAKAKKLLEEASRLNNPDSFYFLGDIYENGYGVEQDYSKAIEYYEKASEFENSHAFLKLGDIYYYGNGIKQDYIKAKDYYEKASELNDSTALYRIGYLYEYGQGVEKDYSIALKFYEKSSEDENHNSLYKLGCFYENGHGVKQDYLKAKEYYEKSSAFGNLDANNNLGDLYCYGFGVVQDYMKAKECYEKSSEFNDSRAFNNLGDLYFNGKGVEQDILKAKEYYEKSSENNNSDAFNKLGDLYKNGQGVEQDFSKAKKYYKKSSSLGNPTAFNNLGDLYKNGQGTKKNYLKAKECYEKSSEFNNSESFIKLSLLYENGYGVKKDYLKAKEYYEKSSNLNNPEAHFHLGNFHSDGDIFEIDLPKAINYFLKSIKIERGIRKEYNSIANTISYRFEANNRRYISYNNLGLIYITDFKNEIKAIELMKESAFAEYPFGQNNYGLLNEFYLDKIDNAEYYYEKSAKNNFSIAEFNLGRIFEKNNKIEESIKYFIRASEHENAKLIFRDIEYNDKRLNISKKFIVCFVNLKLFLHFFSLRDYDKCKFYFCKSINDLKYYENDNLIYQFKFIIKNNIELSSQYLKECFSYLRKYILNFPIFNLVNQPNLNLNKFEYSNIFNHDDGNKFIFKTNENKTGILNENQKELISKIKEFADSENKEEEYSNQKELISKIKEFADSENKEEEYSNQKELISKIKEFTDNENQKELISKIKEFADSENKEEEYSNQKELISKIKEFADNINKEERYSKQKELISKFEVDDEVKKFITKMVPVYPNESSIDNEIIFEDPSFLFDFLIQNSNFKPNLDLKEFFINEIKEITEIFNKILFIPPYSILFGRISVAIPNQKTIIDNQRKDIDQSFLDGF